VLTAALHNAESDCSQGQNWEVTVQKYLSFILWLLGIGAM